MRILLLYIFFTFSPGQFFNSAKKPKEPKKPTQTEKNQLLLINQDILIHDMHLFLVNNKKKYIDSDILLNHPDYPILINDILKKMNIIFPLKNNKRGFDKNELEKIGFKIEKSAFIGYENLTNNIRDKIIKGTIDSLKVEQYLSKNK
tara:strand:- start:56 stop:496 length:441 start_codon:yes stop_codon:yes gene_type:complete